MVAVIQVVMVQARCLVVATTAAVDMMADMVLVRCPAVAGMVEIMAVVIREDMVLVQCRVAETTVAVDMMADMVPVQ
jgi:hypothetical protein